jgi:hypothetical protein
MNRHTGMVGLALMSLALGACGSDKTTITTTAPTFTPQQTSGALLTKGDLGTGWTETQRGVFTTRQPENPSIDPSLWCPAGKGDQLVALAGQEGADVELTLGTTSSAYMVRQQAWANADVKQYFTSVSAAVAACTGATWKDSEGNSYTLQPLTAPKIGDESISWTVTIQLTGTTPVTWFSQQTAARFGTVMMVLQGSAAPSTGANATAPNYVTILRAAANKMVALATP